MPRDRRGQLLLVAALVLAVTFVALALVLNTVVFTENLATRNHDRTDDALGFEAAVEEGVGGLVAATNRNATGSFSTLNSTFQAGVAAWDDNATFLSVADGSITATTLVDATEGTRIAQDTPGELTNTSNATVWTMAADVSDARRFVMVVDPSSGGSVNVTVAADGSSATWTVEVADDGGDTRVTAFRNGSQVATTTQSTGEVVVDVTEGTVDGSRVSGWTFAEGVDGAYDIEVTNGSEATGRYQLFVDEPEPAGSGAPTTEAAVYSAEVEVTVRRSTFTYGTTLVVAPEDAPWNETFAV